MGGETVRKGPMSDDDGVITPAQTRLEAAAWLAMSVVMLYIMGLLVIILAVGGAVARAAGRLRR